MQALQRGMAELAGPGGAEAAADALRIVDTYIKVCHHLACITLPFGHTYWLPNLLIWSANLGHSIISLGVSSAAHGTPRGLF